MTTNNILNVTLFGQSGTGAFAGTNSPTFVGPALGTPISGNLANCTNLTQAGGGSGVTAFKPMIQQVRTIVSTVATGSTLIPADNTIPQITEGNEYMTLTITPSASANLLVIDAQVFVAFSVASYLSMALFQDSTANALAAITQYQTTLGGGVILHLRWIMAAGTTSATTFRIRAGGHTAGTMTFNGLAGAQIFGGVMNSYIHIQEYLI